jgi:hypothetical protein
MEYVWKDYYILFNNHLLSSSRGGIVVSNLAPLWHEFKVKDVNQKIMNDNLNNDQKISCFKIWNGFGIFWETKKFL